MGCHQWLKNRLGNKDEGKGKIQSNFQTVVRGYLIIVDNYTVIMVSTAAGKMYWSYAVAASRVGNSMSSLFDMIH